MESDIELGVEDDETSIELARKLHREFENESDLDQIKEEEEDQELVIIPVKETCSEFIKVAPKMDVNYSCQKVK